MLPQAVSLIDDGEVNHEIRRRKNGEFDNLGCVTMSVQAFRFARRQIRHVKATEREDTSQ